MNKKINAIIVEDEEFPRLSLIDKLSVYHPDVKVIDTCDNCESAMESILKNLPDMLFLDIELPDNNSLWLINQLKEIPSFQMPLIVFTTAHNDSEFLLKAIKNDAVDYILKPVSVVDLTKAVEKVKNRLNGKLQNSNDDMERSFTFKTLSSILKVKESELVYCESDGYCSKLFFINETSELIFENLGAVERYICNDNIIRAGRKYIINTRYIFKVDVKKNTCYFLLPVSGKLVGINLSEGGVDIIRKYINE